MPSNKYALIRYRIIDDLIRNHHYPTKEGLRQACEEKLYGSSDGSHISSSTIDKDLAALRNEDTFGYAPIEFHKEYKGYYYSNPSYSFSDTLSKDEIDLIRLATSVLSQFKGSNVLKQLESTIDRISSRIQAEDSSLDWDQIVQFESIPDAKGTEYLSPILKAIASCKRIKIKYQPFWSEKSKTHIIKPYLLKEYRNRWYLIGYFNWGGEVTIFGLDRIVDLEIQDKSFERNKDFDSVKIFKDTLGITINTTEPFEVKLSINKQEAEYIKSLPLHHSQKIVSEDENKVIISLFVNDSYELESAILGLGNQVKVIEPEDLKARIIKKHQESLKNYSKF
jgi:predicted DNA-binding transcriptional regulator YafY